MSQVSELISRMLILQDKTFCVETMFHSFFALAFSDIWKCNDSIQRCGWLHQHLYSHFTNGSRLFAQHNVHKIWSTQCTVSSLQGASFSSMHEPSKLSCRNEIPSYNWISRALLFGSTSWMWQSYNLRHATSSKCHHSVQRIKKLHCIYSKTRH